MTISLKKKKKGEGGFYIHKRVKKFLANQVKISLSFFNCRATRATICMLSSLAFICPSGRQMSEDFESCGQATCPVGHAAASLRLPGRAGRPAKGESLHVTYLEGWDWRLNLEMLPLAPGTCSHPPRL